VGLYVDDFVFFSEDPAQEDLFKRALAAASNAPIDFMGTVDYFLGTAFTWNRHDDGELSVLLTQSAFIEYTAHRFAIDKLNPVPNMTPYRSGVPIDSIALPDPNDPDLKQRTKCYQAIVGCLNWLATCTLPDIAPALTFLASYNTNPSHQHYKLALHVLKYIYSTSEYGISSHSAANNTIQAFNHFPHHHNKEAYPDATPPLPSPRTASTSLPSVMPAEAANSATLFPMAPSWNYSSIGPSLAILSAALAARSPGKPSDKIKQQIAPALPKSTPPTNASTIS
jgi:hypothetical protein